MIIAFNELGAHHMGSCKMGFTRKDSVVDRFGRCMDFPTYLFSVEVILLVVRARQIPLLL